MFYYPQVRQQPYSHSISPRNNKKIISVVAQGNISAEPDTAKVSIGVVTENIELTQAQAENSKRMQNLLNKLTSYGITKDKRKTETYRIEPMYDYQDGKQKFRGYRVTNIVEITIDDISKVGPILDAAAASGANSVYNIQFTVSNPELYQNQALNKALDRAFEKAVTIANTLGVTLDTIPIKVSEGSSPQLPQPFIAKAEVVSSTTPIEPGQLTITSTVEVQYQYV